MYNDVDDCKQKLYKDVEAGLLSPKRGNQNSPSTYPFIICSGALGISPYGLNTGSAPPGSQRTLPFFLPNDREPDRELWAPHGRGPAVSLDHKQLTSLGNPGTPSPSSRSAAEPTGPPTWKASWSTTSGQLGSGHSRRRPTTSGPPACVPPSTTRRRPCSSGSTGPWRPPQAQGRGKEDKPQRIRRSPQRKDGGTSPRTSPRTAKAEAGGSGHRAAGSPTRRALGGAVTPEPTTTRTTIAVSPGDNDRRGTRDNYSATRGIRGTAKGPGSASWRKRGPAERPMGLLRQEAIAPRAPGRAAARGEPPALASPSGPSCPPCPKPPASPEGPQAGGGVAGGDGPPGDAARRLEVWEQAPLPVPQPHLQDRLPQMWCAKSDGQMGAPRGPSIDRMQVRSRDPPELHWCLPDVRKPHPAPGRKCGPARATRPCRPPASVETCTATLRSLSCSGPKRSSTWPDRRRSPGLAARP